MTLQPTRDLLEREDALSELRRAMAEAQAGLGRCVVLAAEAGHGKTSLLAAAAAGRGPQVRWLQAGCDALHTPRPLGPLIDLAGSLPPEVGQALRAAADAARTYNGLFPLLLDALRGPAPLTVLAIEDVHWADEATLDCLRYLGRRLHTLCCVLIVSLRPEEADGQAPLRKTLAGLDPAITRRLALPPLTAAAVAELARRHQRPAEGLHELSGGHPFYVQQLLLTTRGTRWPATVRDAVLAQADALSASARQAADWLACSPGGLELDTLLELQPDAASALAQPAARSLLEVHPPKVSFRHELARQVLEDALPPVQRWQHHRQLFQLLVRQAPQAGDLARCLHHAAAAGLTAEVSALAPQAAAQAEAVAAYRAAVRWLKLALAHADDAPLAQRAALYDRLALRCYFIQASEESVAARHEAIALKRRAGDTVGAAASLAQLAVQLTPDPQALVLAQQALDELGGHRGSAESAMVHSALAISLVNAGQSAQALQHAEQALRCADASQQMESRVHSGSIAASVALAVAPSAQAFDRLARCIDEAMVLGPDRAAVPLVNLTSVALAHGEYERVLEVSQRGMRYCDDRDLGLVVALLTVRRAVALVELARWDEARLCLQGLEEQRSVPSRQLRSAAILRAQLDALQGGANDAASWEAAVQTAREGQCDLTPAFVCLAAAQAAWLREDAAETTRLAKAGLEVADSPWMTGQYRAWLGRAGQLLPNLQTPLPEPFALAEAGRWQGAHAHWMQRGCRFHAALALLAGDEAANRQALDLLIELKADAAAGVVRRRLQALGLPGLRRGPYGARRVDPHGLSARERQIAELLAQGLSNTAIATRLRRSERTVAHHVSAILAKLQVSNRHQVAAQLARATNTG
jgi:DNA-binding CsgD family transcriptional regulator